MHAPCRDFFFVWLGQADIKIGDNIAVSNLSRLRPDMVISPHPVTLSAAGDAS